MQSYYEKYENLLDSDFQDFIGRELPFGMCEVLPHDLSLVLKLSILHRNLIGHGSHRHLTSSIRVNIKPESISELPFHHCEVIIIERLPSGVFADPFELQHLLQRGGIYPSCFSSSSSPSSPSNENKILPITCYPEILH